jgi:hypothetical protein
MPDRQCTCRPGEFLNLPQPLFRMVCHCQTCQAFFGKPYNDECTFWFGDAAGIALENMEFKAYQSQLSPIRRGTCLLCGKVTCCLAKVGPIVLFLMVSSDQLRQENCPKPVSHIYYHRRLANAEDQAQKVSGHFFSQLEIVRAVVASLGQRLKRRAQHSGTKD